MESDLRRRSLAALFIACLAVTLRWRGIDSVPWHPDEGDVAEVADRAHVRVILVRSARAEARSASAISTAEIANASPSASPSS